MWAITIYWPRTKGQAHRRLSAVRYRYRYRHIRHRDKTEYLGAVSENVCERLKKIQWTNSRHGLRWQQVNALLLFRYCARHLEIEPYSSLDLRDFDLSWWYILVPFLWPFVSGSEKSRCDNMANESASITLLILGRSLSLVKLCLSFCEGRYICTLRNKTPAS